MTSLNKQVVVALESLGNLNRTVVFFAIGPEQKHSKIPNDIESLIKVAFVTLVDNQLSFRLTESLFGQPFLFEVLKFLGGITVLPSKPVFPLQKAQLLFNFTLHFSIYQLQSNFEELTSQLKKGINLAELELRQGCTNQTLTFTPKKPIALPLRAEETKRKPRSEPSHCTTPVSATRTSTKSYPAMSSCFIPVSSPLPRVVFAHNPPPARNTLPTNGITPSPSPTTSLRALFQSSEEHQRVYW